MFVKNKRSPIPKPHFSSSLARVELHHQLLVMGWGAGGASAIRFSVRLDYFDGSHESFSWLSEAESKKVYKEIVEILNGKG